MSQPLDLDAILRECYYAEIRGELLTPHCRALAAALRDGQTSAAIDSLHLANLVAERDAAINARDVAEKFLDQETKAHIQTRALELKQREADAKVYEGIIAKMNAAHDERDQLAARVRELEAALQPFADETAARPWLCDGDMDGFNIGGSSLNNGQLRRAAELLKPKVS